MTTKKNLTILVVLIFVFVGLHLLGIHFPYHQDEYKWMLYSHPEIITPGTVPHPPLTEFIYTRVGPIVGDNNFRFIPFTFGLIDLLLLYYLVKYLFDEKTALISSAIFTFSFYSLLATLMVDVDGAIMPFFFLVFLHGYFRWKEKKFALERQNLSYIILIIIGAVGGFLIKVSTILPLLAAGLDFALDKKMFSDKKKVLRYFVGVLFVTLSLGLILILSKYIFPFFNLKYSIGYWEHFANSSSFWDRGWFQTLIQCIKAVLYTSPLLMLSPLYMKKEDLLRLRVLYFFIGFAIIFYVFLFDFSIGALDRYWQLLVVPLTISLSSVLSNNIGLSVKKERKYFWMGLFFSTVIILLQYLPHIVPPLHPKTEWINRFLTLKWNFVYPFSGGSGPLGFYVSFLVISLSWLLIFFATLVQFFKKDYKKYAVLFVLPLAIMYNLVFIEEYLFGYWNGSAPRILADAVTYIKNNEEIKMVTVYNDNGGNEIQQIGKYRKRLYIDPKFDIADKIVNLNKYKEHYFVLNVPRIDPNSIYQKYFNSCSKVYEKIDKKISGTIYDCRKAPDIKL